MLRSSVFYSLSILLPLKSQCIGNRFLPLIKAEPLWESQEELKIHFPVSKILTPWKWVLEKSLCHLKSFQRESERVDFARYKMSHHGVKSRSFPISPLLHSDPSYRTLSPKNKTKNGWFFLYDWHMLQTIARPDTSWISGPLICSFLLIGIFIKIVAGILLSLLPIIFHFAKDLLILHALWNSIYYSGHSPALITSIRLTFSNHPQDSDNNNIWL